MAAPIDDVTRRLNLITQRLPPENIRGIELIEAALRVGGKAPRCFWETAPTGKPHIGYLIPILKFADFLDAGVDILVVLGDVYSFLHQFKYPMEQVLQRMQCYKFTIMAALEAVGIPSSKVRFIQESSYANTPKFTMDQWKLFTIVSQQAIKDTWDRSDDPDVISPMLCPGIQSLAEEYLDVDFQFGGDDQEGIFTFADRFLPQLGYKKRAHVMNPMLPNLLGGKMSSSHPASTKITFLDDIETVIEKIREANTKWTNGTTNGVMASLRDILIPASQLQARKSQNGIDRTKFGGILVDSPDGTVFSVEVQSGIKHYSSYEEIEKDLFEGRISSGELSNAVAGALNQLLDPIRKAYAENKEWQAVDKLAYPEDN